VLAERFRAGHHTARSALRRVVSARLVEHEPNRRRERAGAGPCAGPRPLGVPHSARVAAINQEIQVAH